MTPLAAETVGNYPRPPAIQPVPQPIRIVFAGVTIATTAAAFRILETTHPPVYYLPPAAFLPAVLHRAPGGSLCEWKGRAVYWSLHANGRTAERAGWSYPTPLPPYEPLRDHIAVYAGAMDACFVGDEQVTPQPGNFYGGWITTNLTGPFKGIPNSTGW